MLDSIKKSFYIVKDFPIISLPIVIYLFLVFLFLSLLKVSTVSLSFLIFVIAFTLLTIAFYTGWLFIIKKGINLYNKEFTDEEEKLYKSLSLIKKFFSGVGKYFLPVLCQLILYLLLLFGIALLANKIGTSFLTKLNFSTAEVKILALQNEETMNFIKNLPLDKLIVLSKWLVYVSSVGLLFMFITMYWQSAIFYSTRNPLMAFFVSVKFLFKNFLKSLFLMLFLIFLHIIFNLFASFSMMNIVLNFVAVLVSFYLFIYSTVLIFVYYEKESNSNSRTDGVG